MEQYFVYQFSYTSMLILSLLYVRVATLLQQYTENQF